MPYRKIANTLRAAANVLEGAAYGWADPRFRAEDIDMLDLDPRVIDELSELAKNPDTREEILKRLAGHRHRRVRLAVSGNYATPWAVLKLLLNDKNPNIRRDIATHRNTPVAALKKLIADKSPFVRYWASQNRKTPRDLARKALQDPEVRKIQEEERSEYEGGFEG